MANMMNVTCPCCGGSLKFNSQLQKVKCEFCDTEFSVDDLKSYDEELNNKFEENTEWDESNLDEFSNELRKSFLIFVLNKYFLFESFSFCSLFLVLLNSILISLLLIDIFSLFSLLHIHFYNIFHLS